MNSWKAGKRLSVEKAWKKEEFTVKRWKKEGRLEEQEKAGRNFGGGEGRMEEFSYSHCYLPDCCHLVTPPGGTFSTSLSSLSLTCLPPTCHTPPPTTTYLPCPSHYLPPPTTCYLPHSFCHHPTTYPTSHTSLYLSLKCLFGGMDRILLFFILVQEGGPPYVFLHFTLLCIKHVLVLSLHACKHCVLCVVYMVFMVKDMLLFCVLYLIFCIDINV